MRLEALKEEKHKELEEKYSRKRNSSINSNTSVANMPTVGTGKDYKWDAVDYIQSPFAFIIGALHALPDESFGYLCSKNLTSSRTALLESFNFFEMKDTLEGVTAVHDSITYVDEICQYCQLAIYNELDKPHWDKLFGSDWLTGIPVNLLYNAGAMWVDGVNFWFYNPSTVP